MSAITQYTHTDGTTYDIRDRSGSLRYGTCGTAANTAAKVGTLSGFVRETGATVYIKFTYANTAATPTLNVNSTGAAAIRYSSAIAGNSTTNPISWEANSVVGFTFDGTYWLILNQTGGGSRIVTNASQPTLSKGDLWYEII